MYCYNKNGVCGAIILPVGSRRAGFARRDAVLAHLGLGQPGPCNGEATFAQCMLGTTNSADRRAAHGQSIFNPAAAQYTAGVSALLRDAGLITDGAVLTPVTEADLTVESHDEIVALQERLCLRLFVAHGPHGLMYYMLDRDVSGCKVATVARKLEKGPHPSEGRDPAKWGGRVLVGARLPKTPGEKETIAQLEKIWRENGARRAFLFATVATSDLTPPHLCCLSARACPGSSVLALAVP